MNGSILGASPTFRRALARELKRKGNAQRQRRTERDALDKDEAERREADGKAFSDYDLSGLTCG